MVVIGGSSGAADALRTLLCDLPVDLPAAIFVVLHMPAHSEGIVRTVAAGNHRWPVVLAEDGMRFEHGRIYVASPGKHLLLSSEGVTRLGTGPRENMSRPAIDALFRSAAAAYGPRVVGVLLSGLLSDGVAGLAAIKRCGGLTVVQDPADAKASGMPLAAVGSVSVDQVAPAATLGSVVSRLIATQAGPAVPVGADIQTEVAIAAGEHSDAEVIAGLSTPSPLTCPSCGGVLSAVTDDGPLRFRCQIGHAMTAEVLETQQRNAVHRALAIALRTIEERVALIKRMAAEHRAHHHAAAAASYEERAAEYRQHIEVLRNAIANA